MSKLSRFKMRGPITVPHTGWKSAQPMPLPKAQVIVAKAGAKIVCPKCWDVIGKLRSDLFSGIPTKADQIEFVPKQRRGPKEKAECKVCGTGYLQYRGSAVTGVRLQLHVEVVNGAHARGAWVG